MNRLNLKRGRRSGVMTVELAVVAPLLFMVIFACFEFCRALMATQALEEAARSGCRVAVLRGATTAEVEAAARQILAPSGISTYSLATNPSNPATAARWAPVSVMITASFAGLSWLPLPNFFANKSYTSSCTLPKEYSSGN